MSGERPTQFRLFQEEVTEVKREDEQALNPKEKLKSRGKIEDKVARGKEKTKVKERIAETKRKLKEIDEKVTKEMHEAKRKYIQEGKWKVE